VYVRSLKLRAVRNLGAIAIEPGARFNVFHGDNAQGKTSLLEAIYALCTLRSFRTHRLAELVSFGSERASLAATVERNGLSHHYELLVAPRGRSARVDGKVVRPLSRYFGQFTVVLFAPEDLLVPRGTPADRRRFLDRAVFNRAPGHLVHVQAYEKVLRSRNQVLKSHRERSGGPLRDLLAVYDDQLARTGARLVAARKRYLDELRAGFQAAFVAIARTGAAADLRYDAAWPEGAAGAAAAAEEEFAAGLRALLARSLSRDLARGITTVGPHRDDLQFILDGRPAAAYASQGQLRALVLAWKTAELLLLERTHGDPPVLLLDDVSSELDRSRNEYLFEFISNCPSQCFITTTHPGHILLSADRLDFAVRAGVITPQNTD
jgi:DNA replication and repair protein RecF